MFSIQKAKILTEKTSSGLFQICWQHKQLCTIYWFVRQPNSRQIVQIPQEIILLNIANIYMAFQDIQVLLMATLIYKYQNEKEASESR